MTALLQVQGLRVRLGGREVVHGLDLTIREGERLALVGASGSGKSVSAQSLLRLLPDAQLSGRVLYRQEDLLRVDMPRLRELRGGEIAMIFQEPMTALNPLFTVGDQISEVLQLKLGQTRRQAWQQAGDLLARTGLDEVGRRLLQYPHQLSGGQRQRAMIAMALAGRPRLLLADEPTTALDAALRGQILDLLQDLQQEHGMAVLMITHDLPLVRRFAQRVAVMDQGRLVEEGEAAPLLAAPQHEATRWLLNSVPPRDLRAPQAGDAPMLQAQGITVAYPGPSGGWRQLWRRVPREVLHAVDAQLASGQTLAVVGESGSGKSTLAQAVLNLLPFGGQMRVAGQAWPSDAAAARALRRRVQVLFQDPFSSLSPRLRVQELVAEGLRLHQPQLDDEAVRQRVLQVLAEVGLDPQAMPGLLGRYPHEFSGGQRQRLALARALVVEPDLLVLDEPTSALDVVVQHQVLALLQRLQRERGLAYLLITHDLSVVRAMAHQVLVLQQGRVVEQGPCPQLLQTPQAPYTRLLVQSTL